MSATDQTQAIYDPRALKALSLRALRLEILAGSNAGWSGEVSRRCFVVGSDPEVDVSLDDESVSRQHCEIEHTDAGVRIRDLGSTNGTRVSEVLVVEAYLPLPCTIKLGSAELRVDASDSTVEVDVYASEQLGGMVGKSSRMQELFGLVARAAPTEATVLVSGESGTGKELVARALHDLSDRARGPFVIVDCGAVPADLIESELFGHVRGAFTGAASSRMGAFREARGGTLFLDEVGELAMELQPRLLRALEAREVKPVGTEKREKVDVRIVAATNQPLRSMVRERRFREDLYFRLAHLELLLPPLRERREDIPLLVDHFLQQIAPGRDLQVGYATMERLIRHPWTGNVRELRNYVERAALLSQQGKLETRFLVPPEPTNPGRVEGEGLNADGMPVHFDLPYKDAKTRLVDAFEKEYWRRQLDAHGWNISAAARAAGIHRKSVEYLLRKLDLRSEREG